jgi:hypothetical protein
MGLISCTLIGTALGGVPLLSVLGESKLGSPSEILVIALVLGSIGAVLGLSVGAALVIAIKLMLRSAWRNSSSNW